MLKLFAAAFIGNLATVPHAYLVFPTPEEAYARSAQQCQTLHCNGDTKYWWGEITLTDGSAALVIPNEGMNPSIGLCDATCGLTEDEIAQLKTEEQMGDLLPKPPVPPGDINAQPKP